MSKTTKQEAPKVELTSLLKHYRAARNAAAPLLAIQTPDPMATMASIARLEESEKHIPAIFVWDAIRGIRAVNEQGKTSLGSFGEAPSDLINPAEALNAAAQIPAESVMFVLNAHRHIGTGPDTTQAVQAVCNLRDEFKENGRVLVLLAPRITLPTELETDMLVLDEPLPEEVELKAIAEVIYQAGEQKPPNNETLDAIVAATRGLASFPAEQAIAMSMRREGLALDHLWERKRQMVEQTRGLSVYRGPEKFDSIGGLGNLKEFATRIIHGKRKPRVIVFIDEIEKAINPEGDLSGVSKDQLGALLSFMQDNDVKGKILIGPPGTAKSHFAKAMGNEAEIPTVMLDMGGMKGGIVGESEANIRNALKVCKAIGGERLLFIATCNSIGALPVELRRRFTLGTFFMDLPDADERAAIWKIYIAKYGLGAKQAIPPNDGWTGAEIKQCCDLADSLEISLVEASSYVVPVATSAKEKIDALREQANNRYISAGKPGLYVKPDVELKISNPLSVLEGGRRLRME